MKQRFLTAEYTLGQEVAIVRTRHGWFDGRETGTIISLSDSSAIVKTEEGYEYEVEHCRDMYAI